jgi:hypothetical protein
MGFVRPFFGEQMIILPRQARDEREATQKELHLLMQGTGQTTERITTVMRTTIQYHYKTPLNATECNLECCTREKLLASKKVREKRPAVLGPTLS